MLKSYVLIRRDLDHGQRLVQTAQVTLALGKNYLESNSEHPSLVCLGVKDEEELREYAVALQSLGVRFQVYFEAFSGSNTITALATYPSDESHAIFEDLDLINASKDKPISHFVVTLRGDTPVQEKVVEKVRIKGVGSYYATPETFEKANSQLMFNVAYKNALGEYEDEEAEDEYEDDDYVDCSECVGCENCEEFEEDKDYIELDLNSDAKEENQQNLSPSDISPSFNADSYENYLDAEE